MDITGKQIIGYANADSAAGSFKSGEYTFEEASADNVDQAAQKATAAFTSYKQLPAAARIKFLEEIAAGINNNREMLAAAAQEETHLPQPRLSGEIDRTINQINLFINLLKEGSWVNAIIDTAKPDRQPMPKPHICQILRPLGVTAVFGASNFPFAFSVAGGDTISALAAGCPVIFKAHFGHPVTSRLVGQIIAAAAKRTGLPDGVFSLVHGKTTGSGKALVTHSLIKAVGFTGSLGGGRALFDLAVKRDEPIPVYAEMGSVNPVFLMPGKLNDDALGIAKSLVASNTMGIGQFCTNPGIILMLQSPAAATFLQQYAASLAEASGGTMLTDAIYTSYCEGISTLQSTSALKSLAFGVNGGEGRAVPQAFTISGKDFLKDKSLFEEHFGPVAIMVLAGDMAELLAIAGQLPGQLTASIWASQNDVEDFAGLLNILEEKAGRLMINNMPTGVEVTHAMLHGGPYPATTDSRSTSVGSQAIYRYTRPVCFQNFPQELLPPELQNSNPLDIWRKVDGEMTKDSIV